MNGFFITFEGIEGAGKTTQLNLFADYLQKNGFDYLVTREPGGTPIGEQIRSILLNPQNREMDSIAEVFLYAASRAQHLTQLIRPALQEGKIVVCDRFFDSSLAYQGYGRSGSIELIQQVNRLILNGLEPDLTFILDLNPEIGLPRAKTVKNDCCSEQGDRIEQENLEFHRSVRAGYLQIAGSEPGRVSLIDGTLPVDLIQRKIVDLFLRAYRRN